MLLLVCTLAFGLAAFGFGLAVCARLRLEPSDRLEQIAVALGVGMATLAFITSVVAAAGILRRPVLVVVVVVGAALAVWFWRRGPRAPRVEGAPRGAARTALFGVLAVCIVANFIGALAPPSFIDALLYHLYEPQEYLRAGRLIDLPHTWQSYQPIAVEMLYTLGMGLGGDRLPAIVDWGLGLVALLATVLLARRFCGPLLAWVAGAVLYCTAMMAWQATSCFVEPAIAASATLGLYALLRWNETERSGWLVAASLLTAFAASCKLTAALVPVYALMLLVYLSIVRRRPWRATLRAAVLYGVPCAALVLPWYLRSYLLTGNPVYPFLPAIFGANPINDSVKRIMAWFGVGHGVSDLLLAPWHLLSRGDKFENGQFLSPLILLLAPVVIWRARRPGERQGLALVALCWFGTWLATAHIARYLLPIQPLAAVLAADALKDLLASTTFRRRLAVATAAVFIAFGAFTTLLYDAQFVSVVVGRESEDAYLRRTSWFYLAHQDLARELPGSSRVLTDDVPTYYLRIPHQRMAPADYLGGPERLTEVIRAGRFSHVVVHGNAEIIALVSRLAPRVRQVWTRAYEMPQSRSFGGSTPIPVTLYEVVPPL